MKTFDLGIQAKGLVLKRGLILAYGTFFFDLRMKVNPMINLL